MEEDLLSELESQSKNHKMWYKYDFALAQTVLWLGIGASFLSSLATATKPILDKYWPTEGVTLVIAVLAAIPGLTILVDKTFKFATRSSWHGLFMIKIDSLVRGLRYSNRSIGDASADFSELEIQMHNLFPPLDSSSLLNPESGKKRIV